MYLRWPEIFASENSHQIIRVTLSNSAHHVFEYINAACRGKNSMQKIAPSPACRWRSSAFHAGKVELQITLKLLWGSIQNVRSDSPSYSCWCQLLSDSSVHSCWDFNCPVFLFSVLVTFVLSLMAYLLLSKT